VSKYDYNNEHNRYILGNNTAVNCNGSVTALHWAGLLCYCIALGWAALGAGNRTTSSLKKKSGRAAGQTLVGYNNVCQNAKVLVHILK